MPEFVYQYRPLLIVVYLLGVFSLLSILFILSTILVRIYHIYSYRRQERLQERFTQILFDFLENPRSRRPVREIRTSREKEDFFKFCLHYLEILKGTDHQKILDLLVLLDIPIHLIQNLRHHNRWRRAYAAYFLGELRFQPAMDALRKAMSDKFYLVQFYATKSIIQIQDQTYLREAILKLFRIPDLSSYQIKEALIELSEENMELAREIFRNEELDEDQKKIFVDLFAYRRYQPAAEDILLTLVDTTHRELKIACIRALGLLNYTPAIEFLHTLLKEEDWVVKSQVYRALGRIGDLGSLSEFLDSIKSPNFWIRYNAALALYDLGSVGINYLKKIFSDLDHPGHEIAEQILVEKKVLIGEK